MEHSPCGKLTPKQVSQDNPYNCQNIDILKIYLEEQLSIKYHVIKYLILLKMQIIMDIKEV